MKNFIKMFIFCCFFIFLSCNDKLIEPIAPSNNNLPQLLWKATIDANEYAGSIDPFIYKDKVLVSRYNISKPTEPIICFDTSGKKLWEWNDAPLNTHFNTEGYINYKDFFIHTTAPNYVACCININTGKTEWKKNNVSDYYPLLIGKKIIQNKLIDGEENLVVYDFDNINNEIVLYKSNYKNYKRILFKPVWNVYNNDTILYYNQIFYDSNYENFATSMISYNLTKQNMIYDTIVATYNSTDKTNNYAIQVLSDNKLYCGAKFGKVFCLDPLNLNIIWQTDLGQWSKSFGGAGFLIEGSNIFMIDVESTYVYCLDKQTGIVKWKEKTSGNCSGMQLYHNVLYYSSGGDGLIHAIDIFTGKHIWKLESPDLVNDGGLFFDQGCSIDKNNGKMYVTNYRYLLCYQLP